MNALDDEGRRPGARGSAALVSSRRSGELILELPGQRRCSVRIGRDLLGQLPELWQPAWRDAAIIGDSTVLALHGAPLAAALEGLVERLVLCAFPPGEAQKTRATKARLEDQLLEAGLDRHLCVIGLGGGISLDLAGFVAATYMRGVPAIYLPTSLLAQVDAAVGGKTGVNTRHGKNLIGAFHQPQAVLVDQAYLETLPLAEWRSGLAEVVKHAVIADGELFCWLARQAPSLGAAQALDSYPLRRCLELKAAIVAADEREAGRRSVLNLGHTIGHALERATGHALRHGEAVAVGLAVESRLACEQAGLPCEQRQRLVELLEALGLPVAYPALPFEALEPWLALDKKSEGGALRLPLPCALGQMAESGGCFLWQVTRAALARAWSAAS